MSKFKIHNFSQKELRGDFYPMFLNLMKSGFETEAMLFMLSTWNFARFRYAVRSFDLEKFQKELKKLDPFFHKMKQESFSKINFDKYSKDIKRIFDSLASFKGIEKTGAPKLMHIKLPKVFVMWDYKIRNKYGFKEGDAEDYINFLKLMQEKFGKVKTTKTDRT